MNVNNIHNATFAQALPPTYLAQAHTLANWHEYSVFSDNKIGGIGNSTSSNEAGFNPFVTFIPSCRPDSFAIDSQWICRHRELH